MFAGKGFNNRAVSKRVYLPPHRPMTGLLHPYTCMNLKRVLRGRRVIF